MTEYQIEEIEGRRYPASSTEIVAGAVSSPRELAVSYREHYLVDQSQSLEKVVQDTPTGVSVYHKHEFMDNEMTNYAKTSLISAVVIPVGMVADYFLTGSLGFSTSADGASSVIDFLTYAIAPSVAITSSVFPSFVGISTNPIRSLLNQQELVLMPADEKEVYREELSKAFKKNIPFKAKVRSFLKLENNAKYLVAKDIALKDGKKSDVYVVFSGKNCAIEVVSKDPIRAWDNSLRSIITPDEMRAFEVSNQNQSTPRALSSAQEKHTPPKRFVQDPSAVPMKKNFTEPVATDWASEVDIIFTRTAALKAKEAKAKREMMKKIMSETKEDN